MSALRLTALAALAALSLAAGSVARPGATNPHGASAQCSSCHSMAGTAVGAPSLAASTCLDCHPDADHHPIGVAPKDVRVPAGWPLPDGQLSCVTCHEEPSCEADRKGGADLLRGGPVNNTKAFCFRCHEREGFSQASPHAPAKARDAGDASCAACHSGIPEAGAAVVDAKLRFGTGDEGCTECHTGAVHQGLGFHLGQKAPTLYGEAAARLPLDPAGQIRCYTCHEVHGPTGEPHGRRTRLASGVAERAAQSWDPWVVAALSAEAGDHTALGAMLAYPSDDGQLCQACHGEGP